MQRSDDRLDTHAMVSAKISYSIIGYRKESSFILKLESGCYACYQTLYNPSTEDLHYRKWALTDNALQVCCSIFGLRSYSQSKIIVRNSSNWKLQALSVAAFCCLSEGTFHKVFATWEGSKNLVLYAWFQVLKDVTECCSGHLCGQLCRNSPQGGVASPFVFPLIAIVHWSQLWRHIRGDACAV